MVVYSIKDLEKLTGIKAHTLRIWEKRYGIISPHRTDTNIRYYLDEDLKKIMNIALLNRNGYKISKIAQLSPSEIRSIAAELSDVDKSFENQLDGLTFSVLELDEEKFLKIFDANIQESGFKDAMLNVIYPLLDKLGLMWMTGSIEPVHESFVTYLIKRKCLVEIDKLHPKQESDIKFLTFLPPGEKGELSLLFLTYLIKSKGFRVINLGREIDLEQIISAHRITSPDYLLSIIDEVSGSSLKNFVALLSQHCGDSRILLSGLQVYKQKVDFPPNVIPLQSSEEIIAFLDTLVSGKAYVTAE